MTISFKEVDGDFNFNKLNVNLILIPSGTFHINEPTITRSDTSELFTYGSSGFDSLEVFNPMKRPDSQINSQTLDVAKIEIASQFIEHYKKADTQIINESHIEKYADELVKLGLDMKRRSFDCLICPLRGALKPTLQLKIMNATGDNIDFLPYTQGSSGKRDALIMNELQKIIEKRQNDRDNFRIAILDTAIGGQSANRLAALLTEIRKYHNQKHWSVTFYLLHPPIANIQNIEKIKSLSNERTTFNVKRYPVDHLLVEDWDPAIGISISYLDDHIELKHSVTTGRLILKGRDKISVIDSSEMANLMDVLIASGVSDAIRTHPLLEYSHDVWPEYIYR